MSKHDEYHRRQWHITRACNWIAWHILLPIALAFGLACAFLYLMTI